MIKTIPIKSYCSIENLKSFFALCKPRVNALIVFTAVIGMFLSTPGMVPLSVLISAILGIGFVSGAAAAFNCLIEEKIDARMARTRGRPLPMGKVSQQETIFFRFSLRWVRVIYSFLFCKFLNDVADRFNFFCLCSNLYNFS